MKRKFLMPAANRQRVGIVLLPVVLSMCWWLGSAFAEEVYTWTDQDGVTHFSDVPPVSVTSEQIEVEDAYRPGSSDAYPSVDEAPVDPAGEVDETLIESPQTAAEQRREQLAQAREVSKEKQEAAALLCPKYEQRLEQLEPARRVFYTDEQGEQVRMDDEERVGLVEEAKEYIAKNCK